MHDSENQSCPLNDEETFANPATIGLECTCPKRSPRVITYSSPSQAFVEAQKWPPEIVAMLLPMTCERCGGPVMATRGVYHDTLAKAQAMGYTVEVNCRECAEQATANQPVLAVQLVDQDLVKAARQHLARKN